MFRKGMMKVKKDLAVILSAAMVLSSFSVPAMAAEVESAEEIVAVEDTAEDEAAIEEAVEEAEEVASQSEEEVVEEVTEETAEEDVTAAPEEDVDGTALILDGDHLNASATGFFTEFSGGNGTGKRPEKSEESNNVKKVRLSGDTSNLTSAVSFGSGACGNEDNFNKGAGLKLNVEAGKTYKLRTYAWWVNTDTSKTASVTIITAYNTFAKDINGTDIELVTSNINGLLSSDPVVINPLESGVSITQ